MLHFWSVVQRSCRHCTKKMALLGKNSRVCRAGTGIVLRIESRSVEKRATIRSSRNLRRIRSIIVVDGSWSTLTMSRLNPPADLLSRPKLSGQPPRAVSLSTDHAFQENDIKIDMSIEKATTSYQNGAAQYSGIVLLRDRVSKIAKVSAETACEQR